MGGTPKLALGVIHIEPTQAQLEQATHVFKEKKGTKI